jgi:hypothetical protein
LRRCGETPLFAETDGDCAIAKQQLSSIERGVVRVRIDRFIIGFLTQNHYRGTFLFLFA